MALKLELPCFKPLASISFLFFRQPLKNASTRYRNRRPSFEAQSREFLHIHYRSHTFYFIFSEFQIRYLRQINFLSRLDSLYATGGKISGFLFSLLNSFLREKNTSCNFICHELCYAVLNTASFLRVWTVLTLTVEISRDIVYDSGTLHQS